MCFHFQFKILKASKKILNALYRRVRTSYRVIKVRQGAFGETPNAKNL